MQGRGLHPFPMILISHMHIFRPDQSHLRKISQGSIGTMRIRGKRIYLAIPISTNMYSGRMI